MINNVSDLEAIEAMETTIAENCEPEVQWGPEDIDVSSFDMVDSDFWSKTNPDNEKVMNVLIEMPVADSDPPYYGYV